MLTFRVPQEDKVPSVKRHAGEQEQREEQGQGDGKTRASMIAISSTSDTHAVTKARTKASKRTYVSAVMVRIIVGATIKRTKYKL